MRKSAAARLPGWVRWPDRWQGPSVAMRRRSCGSGNLARNCSRLGCVKAATVGFLAWNAAGLTGFAALGAALFGAQHAWLPVVAWSAVALFAPSDPDGLAGWPLAPPDAAPASCPAVLMAVGMHHRPCAGRPSEMTCRRPCGTRANSARSLGAGCHRPPDPGPGRPEPPARPARRRVDTASMPCRLTVSRYLADCRQRQLTQPVT